MHLGGCLGNILPNTLSWCIADLFGPQHGTAMLPGKNGSQPPNLLAFWRFRPRSGEFQARWLVFLGEFLASGI